MPKTMLAPSKVFVPVDGAKDERFREIIDRAMEQAMVVLGLYVKDGDVLAVVAKANQDREFEVRLVDAELNTRERFSTNSNKMFLNEIDVLKDAEIAGSVTAYWIMAKMRAFKERMTKNVLAYFYDTEDEKLYALTASEYFIDLKNITDILWGP